MEMFGLPMRMTEGYRSGVRQNELYAQGRTKFGKIVTNAKAGESLHNYGVAADFVFRKQGYDATNDQWLAFASVAERHGFEWGGAWNEFVDRPHIQMMKGYKLKDFQNKLVDYNKFK
jgi:peptidoglycan L-alanyl-D-glutamate endopeptidase CwlK